MLPAVLKVKLYDLIGGKIEHFMCPEQKSYKYENTNQIV